ncbi:MAG: hypothetical protein DMG57_21770 [Acidobacteria bacterium]|nr:MAG: hypothetical protein DMG57_21770 [Acidobacteriota bacterium]
MKILRIAALIVCAMVLAGFIAGREFARGSHLSLVDFAVLLTNPPAVGVLGGDSLARLPVASAEILPGSVSRAVRYQEKSQYLNHTRTVVTHTIDDATQYVPVCLDTLDKYGVKATVFVSTEVQPISQLWPRLERAVGNGHEIGSHSRRHQCHWPDTAMFCFRAYSDYELSGSRGDILRHTTQPYVWSWCYPCGNCAALDFVHRKTAHAGYLIARNYPDEVHDGHVLPYLQTYDAHPYNATYTQVVQKMGGIAQNGRTGVSEVNAKFDEVYQRGGIYNFMSHPQWLDYGPGKFYETAFGAYSRPSGYLVCAHGALYTYHTVRESTLVRALDPKQSKGRFATYNNLDPHVYMNAITLEFDAGPATGIFPNGRAINERSLGVTDRWNEEYFRREDARIYLTVRPNRILEFR